MNSFALSALAARQQEQQRRSHRNSVLQSEDYSVSIEQAETEHVGVWRNGVHSCHYGASRSGGSSLPHAKLSMCVAWKGPLW